MTALLQIEALEKRFGGVLALDGISFELREGEVLGLVGPNGAGKSVLVNVVTGFYRATSGTLQFKGKDVLRMPAHVLAREGVARTFQNIRLFQHMSVLENVLVGFKSHAIAPFRSLVAGRRRQDIDRAMHLLDRFRLADRANDVSGSLSYGESRRLEIARAMAGEPSLLMLDEPAAGMNDRETEELREEITSLRREISGIVVIEHDVSFLSRLCDRFVVMDYGRKVAEGLPADVMRDPQVIAAYVGASDD